MVSLQGWFPLIVWRKKLERWKLFQYSHIGKKLPKLGLLLDWNLQRKHRQEISLEEDRGLFFI